MKLSILIEINQAVIGGPATVSVTPTADLGALVRKMPEHTALERHMNGWVHRTQRFDSASPSSTPESALRELNTE